MSIEKGLELLTVLLQAHRQDFLYSLQKVFNGSTKKRATHPSKI